MSAGDRAVESLPPEVWLRAKALASGLSFPKAHDSVSDKWSLLPRAAYVTSQELVLPRVVPLLSWFGISETLADTEQVGKRNRIKRGQ